MKEIVCKSRFPSIGRDWHVLARMEVGWSLQMIQEEWFLCDLSTTLLKSNTMFEYTIDNKWILFAPDCGQVIWLFGFGMLAIKCVI